MNETFSKKYKQLEKIEMEIKSSLKLIHRKFQEAMETDKTALKNCDIDANDFNGTMEIANALKTDAMGKCARKLGSPSPLVRIQRLSMKQVTTLMTNQRTNKSIAPNLLRNVRLTPFDKVSKLDVHANKPIVNMTDHPQIKKLSFNEIPFEDNLDLPIDIGEIKVERFSENVLSYTYDDLDVEPRNDNEVPVPVYKLSVKNEDMRDASEEQMEEEEQRLNPHRENPPEIYALVKVSKSDDGVAKPIIDPNTGKLKCSLCEKEYSTGKGYHQHYDAIHLNVRYKCTECGKEFTQLGHCKSHHKSVHLGISFNCYKCNTSYATKSHPTRHQQLTKCKASGYSKQLSCRICGKRYSQPNYLKNHFKKEHLKSKEHACDQCGKTFVQVHGLRNHIKVVHQDIREHSCNMCGKRFGEKYNLTCHQQLIHGLAKERK